MLITKVALLGGGFVFSVDSGKLDSFGFSAEQIEEIIQSEKSVIVNRDRSAAYKRESDPLFLEALRKDAAGDIDGAEEARAAALVAVEAIKERYPLPTE